MKAKEYVLSFEKGVGKDKKLLGGKGANLCGRIPPRMAAPGPGESQDLRASELPPELLRAQAAAGRCDGARAAGDRDVGLADHDDAVDGRHDLEALH